MEITLTILVAALSVLVMLLIGWQIYTFWDVKKIQKEIAAKRDEIAKDAERYKATMYMALSDFYYSLIIDQPIKDREFEYLKFRISALLHSSRYNDDEYCEVIVGSLLGGIGAGSSIPKWQKQELLNILLSVSSPNEIKGFQTLLRIVLNMKEI